MNTTTGSRTCVYDQIMPCTTRRFMCLVSCGTRESTLCIANPGPHCNHDAVVWWSFVKLSWCIHDVLILFFFFFFFAVCYYFGITFKCKLKSRHAVRYWLFAHLVHLPFLLIPFAFYRPKLYPVPASLRASGASPNIHAQWSHDTGLGMWNHIFKPTSDEK